MWQAAFFPSLVNLYSAFSLFSSYFHTSFPYLPSMLFTVLFSLFLIFLSSACLPVVLELLSFPNQWGASLWWSRLRARGSILLEAWTHLCPKPLLSCFNFFLVTMWRVTKGWVLSFLSEWIWECNLFAIWIEVCFLQYTTRKIGHNSLLSNWVFLVLLCFK